MTLFACQFAFLVLRRLGSTVIQTNASLAADVLEVVAISSAIVLSYIHHCRSIRPSTLLTLFLSARSLVGIARVRTLWLIPDETTKAIVFTIGFIFTLISLVFESSEKESIVIPETEKPATPEPFSGFWKQASFAWLAGTFRLGYSKVISVDDLPDLDPRLDTEVVAHRLQSVWSKQGNARFYDACDKLPVLIFAGYDMQKTSPKITHCLSLASVPTMPHSSLRSFHAYFYRDLPFASHFSLMPPYHGLEIQTLPWILARP